MEGFVRVHAVLAPILTAVIVLAYAASLWWLLRQEITRTMVGIVALCGVSMSLRLVYTTDYPAGLNDDEPKILRCAIDCLREHRLLAECVGMPVTLNALFEAQLMPVFETDRSRVRTYSLVTSVMSTAVAFAVARGLGLSVVPSLAVSALIATLPWSLFYGRVSQGGEMLFHELLLLAALARLVWVEEAGWVDVVMGGFALALLHYDYYCGRAMVGMPLLAALLARGGRRRLQCLLILAVAFAGWVPYLRGHPDYANVGFSTWGLHPGLFADPALTLYTKTRQALLALTGPYGWDNWLTIRSAAVHPWYILGIAVLGSLVPVRRGLFLWGGFLGGLVPAVVSWGDAPSTHRMLMAYPFIALAAGAAFNLIRWPAVRGVITAAVVGVAGVQSVLYYFSPAFWPPETRGLHEWERTELAEALPRPPHPRVIAMSQIGYFIGPWAATDSNYEFLSVDNWYPPNNEPSIYAFTPQAGALAPFYADLFGYERVRYFGRAFMVQLEARDWSWLREHGWSYEAHCGTAVRSGQVPTLFHTFVTFKGFGCNEPMTHVWRGRWMGPAAALRLRFSGKAVVEGPNGRLAEKAGFETAADFTVEPGTDLTITLTTQPPENAVLAVLMEVTPAGEFVPIWQRVTPNPPANLVGPLPATSTASGEPAPPPPQ